MLFFSYFIVIIVLINNSLSALNLRLQNYLNFIISHPDFLSFKLFFCFSSLIYFIFAKKKECL